MKPKFTPGPWHIERRHPDPETNANLVEILPAVGGCHGEWSTQEICNLHLACPGSIQEANARLIAAAPELLAMLREMSEEWADKLGQIAVNCGALDRTVALDPALAKARALIAKAEGRA